MGVNAEISNEDPAEIIETKTKQVSWTKRWEKEFGNIFVPATSIADKKTNIISVSPSTDLAIKGVPEGVWVVLSGPPKFGKSSMALQIAANAQQQYDKPIFYIDAEGRFKKMNLQIRGLDLNKITIIQSTKEKILSAESTLNIAMDILKHVPGCILIIDSTSALCAEKELTDDISANTRASGPKLMASFCRQMATVVPVQQSIVICIQHLIANTSGYGSPYMEDGGRKIQYQADIKLRGKGIEKWKNPEGVQIGQIIKWEVNSSALGPPGGEIENYLRYGVGIDQTMELLILATDLGIIQQKGAWYSSDLLGGKWQGQEKLYQYLENEPNKLKLLWAEVKKLV